MHWRVLGPLEVVVDGRTVELGGLKQRSVLALLIAARGRTVSVDRLVDEVWGEDPPAKVMTSVQSYVANLRRVVEPGRGARARPATLVTRAPGYALLLDPKAVDAEQFSSAVAAGRALIGTDPAAAVRALDRGLALWRGDAYADTAAAAPSLTAEAARLGEARLLAQEDRWQALIDLGEHGVAGAELQSFLVSQPLRERSWALLALALYRGERQSDALDAVTRARRLLADELGLDPGAALRDLEQAILRHDPALLGPHPRAAPTQPAAPPVEAEPERPAAGPGLVGRDAELAAMIAAVDRARGGSGQLVLVSGEAGIGKSALVTAVLARAGELGVRVGLGRWEEDESAPPLWAWREALGDARAIDRAAGAAGNTESTLFAVAEAVVAELREAGPSLLVLDDAHWADRDSMRLLRLVATRLAPLPVALVVTFRQTGPATNPALADALAVLATTVRTRLELTGLDTAAITRLCRDTHGVEVAGPVAAALRERTGGNPFYVAELVRLLARRGELRDPAAVAALDVPDGVRDVVRRRLTRLPATAATVLTIAAVAGQVFDVDVLESASGLDEEEVAAGVEAALLAGLLDELTPTRYAFTHALTREAVYGQLVGPRRARLHAAVAGGISRCRAAELEVHAESLAQHLSLAGARHAAETTRWALVAAGRATASGAGHEAVRWATTAAQAVAVDPSATWAQRHEVAVALIRARFAVGAVREASACVAWAAEAALAAGHPVAAAQTLLLVTSNAWHWREYGVVDGGAVDLLRRVLATVPADEVLLRAQLTACLAAELSYGDAETSVRLAREALAVLDHLDPDEVADDAVPQLLLITHFAFQRNHQLDEHRQVTERLVQLLRHRPDDARLALALTWRGGTYFQAGDWVRGHEDHAAARELARDKHLVELQVVLGYAAVITTIAEGSFEVAAEGLAEVRALHATTTVVAAEHLRLLGTANLLLPQGRLGELELELRPHRDTGALRDLHTLSLLEAGRLTETGAWRDQPPIPQDFIWLARTAIRALIWSRLDDAEAIRDLRDELTPFHDRPAWGGTGILMLGPVSGILGVLALAAGDQAAADRHLAEARRTIADHGWRGLPPQLARALITQAGDVGDVLARG